MKNFMKNPDPLAEKRCAIIGRYKILNQGISIYYIDHSPMTGKFHPFPFDKYGSILLLPVRFPLADENGSPFPELLLRSDMPVFAMLKSKPREVTMTIDRLFIKLKDPSLSVPRTYYCYESYALHRRADNTQENYENRTHQCP